MSWVAVAIGGGAILNYLGSSGATSAQTNAANQATQTQIAQAGQTRADQMPYMNRGNAAGNQLAYLLGLNVPGAQTQNTFDADAYLKANPDVAANAKYGANPYQHYLDFGQREGRQAFWNDNSVGANGGGNGVNTSMGAFGSLSTPFGKTDWTVDPGYQFRLSEGQKALERSGAAKGMSLSGGQLKALTNYNQGAASQEYGQAYNRYNNDQTNLFNRLSGVAGTGQQANQFVGQLGANTANQISSNQLGAGNANAAGWIAGTNALSNGINQGLNYWSNQNIWNSLNNQPNSNYWGSGGENPFGAGMGT